MDRPKASCSKTSDLFFLYSPKKALFCVKTNFECHSPFNYFQSIKMSKQKEKLSFANKREVEYKAHENFDN